MIAIDLTGRRALVTGAGRGLGGVIAETLAQAGARVVVNDLTNEDEWRQNPATQSLPQSQCLFRQADVSDPHQVDEMFQWIDHKWGGLDILINNAGVAHACDYDRITPDQWDRVIGINLRSVFLCSQQAAKRMTGQNFGRIIHVSSVVARQGALYGHLHYAASKSGMIGMAKTLARSLAPYTVTVNTVAPGMIDSDMLRDTLTNEQQQTALSRIPLKRFCQSQEVAHLCAYLASDLAGYITGVLYDINGGMVMDG